MRRIKVYTITCESTVSSIIGSTLNDFFTVKKKTTICSLHCQVSNFPPYLNIFRTYKTMDEKIENLQSFLDNCLHPG